MSTTHLLKRKLCPNSMTLSESNVKQLQLMFPHLQFCMDKNVKWTQRSTCIWVQTTQESKEHWFISPSEVDILFSYLCPHDEKTWQEMFPLQHLMWGLWRYSVMNPRHRNSMPGNMTVRAVNWQIRSQEFVSKNIEILNQGKFWDINNLEFLFYYHC